MRYFYIFLRGLVGITFVVSGASKLYPIEPFENIFIELGLSNWLFVPFVARFIIAFELFIGIAIIFNIWLKNKVYYLAHASLILFSGYLVYLLITMGNDVDCGCFGSLIEISPLASLSKNVVLIIALLFIPRQYHSYGVSWGVTIILACSIAIPIVLNPIGIHNVQGILVDKKIDFSELPNTYKTNQKINFSEGKKVVAFFSYKCGHCINAATKLSLLNEKQKIENLFFVVGSKKEEGLFQFIEKTKPSFPIIWMKDDSFLKYAGGNLPAIIYVDNGKLKKKWIGELFDVDDIGQHFTD